MIEFEPGGIYPLIKVTTPPDINFFTEHKKAINKYGLVWFCRFGKSNMKVASLESCCKVLIIKESKKNGDGVYIAPYDIVHEGNEPPYGVYPTYYDEIIHPKSLWIRLTDIEKISKTALESTFVVNTSGNKVSGILKSMCPAVFIRYEGKE